jgi:YVTN family beta-propeller protein
MDFRILGPLEVREDGTPLRLGGGKQRALLAFLLLHPKEAVSTDRLIDGLWGERAPPTAGKIVQNYVSQLRRALRDGLLVTQGGGYSLQVEPGERDLDRFLERFEQGRRARAAGDPERASRVLREALGLWRGRPLSEFAGEPFAQDEIGRLEELHLRALIERIDAELDLGRHADLVGELESLVARHPLQERLRGQLMLALYRSGRQAEALQVYQDARRMLAEELGIEPGQALQQLNRSILTHDPALEPVPRLGATARAAKVRRRGSKVAVALAALVVAGAVAVAVTSLTGSPDANATTPVPPNSVGVIDPSTNSVVDTVPVGNFPTRIAFGGGSVWSMNAYDKTVSRIDPSTGRVSNTLAIGGHGLAGIAVDTSSGWVVNGGDGTLRHFGIVDNEVDPSLRIARPYGTGADVALGRDAVWVTSQSQRTVFRVDPARFNVRVVDRVPTPVVPLAIAVDRGAIWITGFDPASKAGVLMRLEPARGALRPTIPLEGIPGDVAIGHGALWVTVNSENTVWRINPRTGSVVRTIQVGAGPLAVAVGEDSVWVVNAKDGTVSRIDPATNRVVVTVPVGGSPRDVAVGGGRVWVAVS